MNKILEDRLVAAAPKLYKNYEGDARTTCMAWGFECGDGWFGLLLEASQKLETLNNEGQDIIASQVKEKFGTLRFYIDGGDNKADKIVKEAEKKSAVTCETCGEPGKLQTDGWFYVACKEHILK